jgi:hypothetical protein
LKSKRKRAAIPTEYALPAESRWISNEAVVQQK